MNIDMKIMIKNNNKNKNNVMLDKNVDRNGCHDVVHIPQGTDGKAAHAGINRDNIVTIYKKKYKN